MNLLQRILPARIDNRFRGHVLALWLLLPIGVMKVGVSLVHIFRADGGAQSVARIPLDSYPASAAQNVIGLFARLGLEQLLLGALLVLALVGYRAMIPLMYLLVVVHYVGSRLIAEMKPLVRVGEPGSGTPALVIAALSVIGLVLSLTGRRYAEEPVRP